MKPTQNSLFGYENFIRDSNKPKPWELNEKPIHHKAMPWVLIKQMLNDCERLNTDDEETAEMLLDFVRELMNKEIPNE